MCAPRHAHTYTCMFVISSSKGKKQLFDKYETKLKPKQEF